MQHHRMGPHRRLHGRERTGLAQRRLPRLVEAPQLFFEGEVLPLRLKFRVPLDHQEQALQQREPRQVTDLILKELQEVALRDPHGHLTIAPVHFRLHGPATEHGIGSLPRGFEVEAPEADVAHALCRAAAKGLARLLQLIRPHCHEHHALARLSHRLPDLVVLRRLSEPGQGERRIDFHRASNPLAKVLCDERELRLNGSTKLPSPLATTNRTSNGPSPLQTPRSGTRP
mmetsp:Transcript_85257/g.182715  ORF Transcript_85257/g.182715 Transcript_85257/m.182715 type:complete len:229 (+) Transcript_85257:1110-1796(+)